MFTYRIENGILQDSSEPSNDNTNVVNALQEPFVVKQDPGKNSSQSPPQINHHCCYGCGDPLEDIFCHQCTCELCERGPHETCQCDHLIFDDPYCEKCKGPHMNFQCQPMNQNHYEPNPCYDSNSFGFDQFQPPQFPFIHQPIREKTCAELLAKEQEANINTQPFQYFVIPQPPREEISVEFLQEKINQMDSMKTFLRKFNRISFYEMPKDRPTICYYDDDDEDYAIAVTPSLSTEEPDNSLSMGDEHLDTVLATESDEFIKSSVENIVPILSEFKGILDNMCDVPFHDNSLPLDISKDQFEDFSNFNNDSTLYDDDSFSIDNIEYVEASPPYYELVSLEVMEIVILEVLFPKIGSSTLNNKCNLFHQWDLFTSAGGTLLHSSGNFFWQWELITGSRNALSILFPTILP
nr:hypothetical protein [Tanacetum cinerariifolium]